MNDSDRYVATIFERKTDAWRAAAQRDDAFEDSILTFWIRPAIWLHSVHEIAVSISWSPQHSWWGLVLAETCSAGNGWLCMLTSRAIFRGDVVRWLLMHAAESVGCMFTKDFCTVVIYDVYGPKGWNTNWIDTVYICEFRAVERNPLWCAR